MRVKFRRAFLPALIILWTCVLSAQADTLVIPNGTERIEEEAFCGAVSITEVILPDSVIYVGPRAFAESGLKVVYFTKNLKEIGEDAFPEGTTGYGPTNSYGTEYFSTHEGLIAPAVSDDDKPEASYTTLKIGSTGEAVKNLVTALKEQGYYKGSIISAYTSAVVAAVKAFQEDNGISADGVADESTQHALFGTVPVKTDTMLTMTLYPAEKIDWWTGGINEMWGKGQNYKVYDVKTGIVWWAHRWSGGYHVDAEPLTAGDTARLCKCYGTSSAKEIESRDLYQRRPSLVTIGNRTFACSLYGVPHNYPDGDTIADNEYDGQLCIHFTNSKTHGGNSVNKEHQEAIEYAWLNSPSGYK